jgi:formylglycine-generating enzyme required for sulfatase activity
MSIVFVPAGDFTIGSPTGEGGDEEFPLHVVTLLEYWIDRTEVTSAQYQLFVNDRS